MSAVAEDFLEEDAEISGQKVVLLSFLSPEKILAQKDVFMFEKFLHDYNIQWKTSRLESWLGEQLQTINTQLESLAGNLDLSGQAMVRSSFVKVDRLVEEFQQYTRKNLTEVTQSDIKKDFDDFMFKNGDALEEEYYKLNNFQTTMRGVKVRGVFSSAEEASVKARRLQKADPTFNIYLGYVGKWMAWEPDPNKLKDQEYANDTLNTLMKKYRENEEARDVFYTEQKARRVGEKRVSASASASEATPEKPVLEVVNNEGQKLNVDSMFSGTPDLAIARKSGADSTN